MYVELDDENEDDPKDVIPTYYPDILRSEVHENMFVIPAELSTYEDMAQVISAQKGGYERGLEFSSISQ